MFRQSLLRSPCICSSDLRSRLKRSLEGPRGLAPRALRRSSQSDTHDCVCLISFGVLDVTPITNGKMRSLGKPLELVTPFGQRNDKFVVHSNTENSEDDVIKRAYQKFNHLEDRMMKYSQALVASQLYDELVDPSVASQKTIFTVGIICCEEEGRVKEKPIMLQSSVQHSGGQRVRLELQKLEQFSIFPGQILSVEGRIEAKCILARGERGGHFAELNYHGSPDSSSASLIQI
ncbi:hypothetical protein QVD17_40708 [Tagetes erecta]|uniref:DNA polymerase alpha subunit B OB domain-containing protein n=1 Tax=Tagetes erecta TaxID=13708 RepID=A0AAD8NI27_TARER|nr:hypothetical protein QVD17_40708 [Tagetes erecta]